MLKKRFLRGDTMIEVLLAITVFSIVAVSGLSIMNQGAASAQRSLEITLVRQQMDAQAETLRFMYESALAQRSTGGGAPAPGSAADKWNQVLALRKSAATPFNNMVTGSRCAAYRVNDTFDTVVTQAFVVNPKTATVLSNTSGWRAAETYSRVRYVSSTDPTIARVDGMWIEAVRQNATIAGGVTLPGYTDFHIRACWSATGQAQPATLGTIVRLYEP